MLAKERKCRCVFLCSDLDLTNLFEKTKVFRTTAGEGTNTGTGTRIAAEERTADHREKREEEDSKFFEAHMKPADGIGERLSDFQVVFLSCLTENLCRDRALKKVPKVNDEYGFVNVTEKVRVIPQGLIEMEVDRDREREGGSSDSESGLRGVLRKCDDVEVDETVAGGGMNDHYV